MPNQPIFNYKRVTADGAIKNSSGILHTIVFNATGAVTAGVVTVYDNTAESGTIIYQGTIPTTLTTHTVTLDVKTNKGIFVGYDGTIANVATTVTFL